MIKQSSKSLRVKVIYVVPCQVIAAVQVSFHWDVTR